MNANRWSLIAVTVTLAATGLALAGCGDDGRPSCSEVCDKVVECDPGGSKTECVEDCDDMKAVIRTSSFETLGNCMLDTSCSEILGNEDVCIEEALATAPAGAADGLVDAMCEKTVECDETGLITLEQCRAYMEGEEASLFDVLALFKDSVLDCVSDCFSGASCSELDTISDTCLVNCDAVFGTSMDDDPQPAT